jgi:hypothetical protein
MKRYENLFFGNSFGNSLASNFERWDDIVYEKSFLIIRGDIIGDFSRVMKVFNIIEELYKHFYVVEMEKVLLENVRSKSSRLEIKQYICDFKERGNNNIYSNDGLHLISINYNSEENLKIEVSSNILDKILNFIVGLLSIPTDERKERLEFNCVMQKEQERKEKAMQEKEYFLKKIELKEKQIIDLIGKQPVIIIENSGEDSVLSKRREMERDKECLRNHNLSILYSKINFYKKFYTEEELKQYIDAGLGKYFDIVLEAIVSNCITGCEKKINKLQLPREWRK